MEIATTYAKAVDDLAAKIFIPGLIYSLWIEFGPVVQRTTGANLIETYVLIFFLSLALSWLILYSILYVDSIIPWFDCIQVLGVFLMPLGLAGLFPDQFEILGIPYSRVTGLAVLAWSFMLVRGVPFFQRFFKVLE